ncbi:uncharacterized protein N0V89_011764 [Didymosphaeria variabile]|uniref:Uncharacterized protein n=1 Tax=Didymosphaeria variabile TaxID=1932322 RepID=A0A9W9C5N7_9PLEO|nr:uncharacterized protein N0V89_011764 [Didymosphaeria variabile]KAJ4345630.1 hypothetical protein N0V89_011764 [Didymosphaeria variabile]
MTFISSAEIRGGASKIFSTSYNDKQYDPPAAAESVRRPYWGVPLNSRRQREGIKYDVRAVYPSDHLLSKQVNVASSLPQPSSLNEYFLRARVSEDDKYLRPIWEKETGKTQGYDEDAELQRSLRSFVPSAAQQPDIPSHPPQASFNEYYLRAKVSEDNTYLQPLWENETEQTQGCDEDVKPRFSLRSFLPIVALLPVLTFFGLIVLSHLASSAIRGTVWLVSGICNCALLWVAYMVFPLVQWVRDSAFQISVRTARWTRPRSGTFWMGVVMGLLAVNWVMSRVEERAPIVAVFRRGAAEGSTFRVSIS